MSYMPDDNTEAANTRLKEILKSRKHDNTELREKILSLEESLAIEKKKTAELEKHAESL